MIGGVLIPGAQAPKLVSREMIRKMKKGAVIVDVAIDQGGCLETARPTTHSDPTYVEHGVVHYCVTNMPGAVPRTSTIGLANATLPYCIQLADLGLVKAAVRDPAFARGINVLDGQVTHAEVAEALGMTYTPVSEALAALVGTHN